MRYARGRATRAPSSEPDSASPAVTAVFDHSEADEAIVTRRAQVPPGLGRRHASMPERLVVAHHARSAKTRSAMGAMTLARRVGRCLRATAVLPAPGCARHGCAEAHPLLLPSGLSPSVSEFHRFNHLLADGSRTVTAGSDFHRPRSRSHHATARGGGRTAPHERRAAPGAQCMCAFARARSTSTSA